MEKSGKIKLGLFVIIGTLFFVASMYFIGDKQNLFGSTFKIKAIFSNVNGLQKGNNVRFLGIDVGTVNKIEIINDTSILVTMIIKEESRAFIKKNSISTIGTDGLMGNKLVNITPKNSSSQVVNEGDTLVTLSEIITEDMLRRLEQTNTNIAMISSNLVDITDEIQLGKGTIGKLIKDSTLAQNIEITIENLKEASKKSTLILTNIEDKIKDINLKKGSVGTLLTDTVFAGNIEQMVKEMMMASANTKELTQELKEMIIQMRAGQGVAGGVVSDTIMLNNLEKSMDNIQKGTAAFNENMEALKHNFLVRGYFKKQEKIKQKNKK
ncbi:MAG: hypothetical protein A3K10_00025 [Bacteroidetes bacterium RIFCSPLOWO2_12_FULL_31_6]|nr:MAG: hypothetical protein A3K10_00025 [Bacteroidetes bacterium RIFCSPLOWO2_12_FULL_31_6]